MIVVSTEYAQKIVKKLGVISASLELGPGFLESDPDYNVSKTFVEKQTKPKYLKLYLIIEIILSY